MDNSGRQAQDKVRLSIGTKLVTIISVIVIFSLGSITALVSWMVREDLRIMAEENNFEANRRAAAEVDDTLANIRAASSQLIHTVSIIGVGSYAALEAEGFFFAQNPRIVAVAYMTGPVKNVLVNEGYLLSRGLSPDLARDFFAGTQLQLLRAVAGESMTLNASQHFEAAFLALYFPFQAPGGLSGSGGVLYASGNLIDSFGFGVNQSFMINYQGDLVIHSDFDLLAGGVNVAGWDFIRNMQESAERSMQELIPASFTFEDEAGLSLHYTAFTKLAAGGNIVITGIENALVFESIDATTRRNIFLSFAVLFISIMFIWFFSKTISMPLKLLTGAVRSIESGQFDFNLKFRGRDEIGILGTSFGKMSSALHIFGRFTNRDIAVRAMRGDIKPGGLHKHATIFFSDIRGFTALSEGFTKEFDEKASDKIVFWLNHYLSSMVECVEKTNGVVDKFIGDAVMAHWGTAYTSSSPKEDALNCVKAALMMRQAVMALNEEEGRGQPGNPRIQIGCGINTGMVTAGQIGSELRMEYTVIGDPVNLASRVESLTKPLAADILIAEDTWKLVGDNFITEEMPPVMVKGKVDPVRIFAVINFADALEGPRTLADVRGMLGLEEPDISMTDLNVKEKKYRIEAAS
ncbi:MAG: adenylate/guanylate cyclase domain-containing protein [Spirochaetes bacterium]|nr:adenylate/guanylate cyclase domain-containing protein [Spirochaetota bacterium]